MGSAARQVELWSNGELEAVFPNGLDELRGHYKVTLGYQFVRDIAAYLSTRTTNITDPAVG